MARKFKFKRGDILEYLAIYSDGSQAVDYLVVVDHSYIRDGTIPLYKMATVGHTSNFTSEVKRYVDNVWISSSGKYETKTSFWRKVA